MISLLIFLLAGSFSAYSQTSEVLPTSVDEREGMSGRDESQGLNLQNVPFDLNHLKSQYPKKYKKYQIIRTRLIQEFYKNPALLPSFELDTSYPRSEDLRSLERHAQRQREARIKTPTNIIANTSPYLGINLWLLEIGAKFPTWNKMRGKKGGKREILDYQAVEEMARKVAYGAVLCEDEQLFSCRRFLNTKFFHELDDSWSKGLAESRVKDLSNSWAKAWEDGSQKSDTWPHQTQSWEDLSSQFPDEAEIIEKIENLAREREKDQKNAQREEQRDAQLAELLEIVQRNSNTDIEAVEKRAIARRDGILAQDPVYQGKDPILLSLESKHKLYTDDLEAKKNKLAQDRAFLSKKEIADLTEGIAKAENALQKNEEFQDLRRHKLEVAKGMAWMQAFVDVAVVMNIGIQSPELKQFVQFGAVAMQGFKIYDAVASMLIAGALDPTGISSIAKAVGITMSIVFEIPTENDIINEKLDDILKNQQIMVKKLYKMDHKLNRMEAKLNVVSEQINRLREVMNEQHENNQKQHKILKEKMEDIQHNLLYGFNQVLYTMDKQTHDQHLHEVQSFVETLVEGRGERARTLLSCIDNPTKEKCNDSWIQEQLFEKIDIKLTSLKIYSTKLKINANDIKSYNDGFNSSSVEDSKIWVKEYFDKPTAHKVEGLLPATTNWLNSRLRELGTKNTDLVSVPYKGIAHFQDEVFFELVRLAGFLPIEQDFYGQVKSVSHINEVCKRSQAISDTAQTMRKNLNKAWWVYLFYSDTLRARLYSFFKQAAKIEGLAKMRIQKNNKGSTDLVALHPEFSVFNSNLDWSHLQHAFLNRSGYNEDCRNQDDCKNRIQSDSFYHCDGTFYNSAHYNHSHVSELGKKPECVDYTRDSIQKLEIFNVSHYWSRPEFSPSAYFTDDMGESVIKQKIQLLDPVTGKWALTGKGEKHKWWHPVIMGWGYWKKSEEKIVNHTECFSPRFGNKWPDIPSGASIKCEGSVLFLNGEYFVGSMGDSDISMLQKECKRKRGSVARSFFDCYPQPKRCCYSDKLQPVEVDREKFISENINGAWRAHLKTLYRYLLNDLNRDGLVSEWMKAKLNLSVMARAGYGKRLNTDPKLVFLNNLLNNLLVHSELDLPDLSGVQKETPFTDDNLKTVSRFLYDIENSYQGDIKKDISFYARMAQGAKQTEEENWYPGDWLPEELKPDCETEHDRVTNTIFNARNMMNLLQEEIAKFKQKSQQFSMPDYFFIPVRTEEHRKFQEHLEEVRRQLSEYEIHDAHSDSDWVALKVFRDHTLRDSPDNNFFNSSDPFLLRYFLYGSELELTPQAFYEHQLAWKRYMLEKAQKRSLFETELQNILHSAIYDQKPADFRGIAKEYGLSSLFVSLQKRGKAYIGWGDAPLCEEVRKDMKVWDIKTDQNLRELDYESFPIRSLSVKKLPSNLSSKDFITPVLPLPPEETWEGQPVGFGLPELRKLAFEYANSQDHLKPSSCSIK